MRSSLRGQERGDDTEINDQDPNPDIWRKKPPIKVSKPSIDPRTSSGMLPPPLLEEHGRLDGAGYNNNTVPPLQ